MDPNMQRQLAIASVQGAAMKATEVQISLEIYKVILDRMLSESDLHEGKWWVDSDGIAVASVKMARELMSKLGLPVVK